MDAMEFIREAKRMCNNLQCAQCKLQYRCTIGSFSEETLDVVEKWRKEHPIVTNGMKFKEVFGYDITDRFGATLNWGVVVNWLNKPWKGEE